MYFLATYTPTGLTATYHSTTSVLLEWTFAQPPSTEISYVVYYQSGGVSYNGSFSLRRGSATIHQLNNLPAGGLHSISLVAMRQGLSVLAYLPSVVAGPVDPGMFWILMLFFSIVAPVAPPVVVVSGEGSGVVGTSYTLSCRVSLPSGVEPDSLDIQWLGLSTSEPVMISTGVYISTVTLDPLPPTTTDYTCRASYIENGVSEVVQENLPINVVSKSASSFQYQMLW